MTVHPELISKLSVEGKVAVVTGGGGIRRGIAVGLARAGASVMIGEIIPERAQEAADAIKGAGGRATPVVMDAMDADQLCELAA